MMVLDGHGSPTPVVATRLIPPSSRMAPLTPEELQADIRQSPWVAAYGQAVDRESAREMLAKRMQETTPAAAAGAPSGRPGKTVVGAATGALVGALSSTIGRTIGREVVRGLFGLLGAKSGSGTRRSRW